MILHRCVIVVVALVAMGNAKMSNGVTSASTVSIEFLCIPIFMRKRIHSTHHIPLSTTIFSSHYYRKESISNRSFPGRNSGASQPRRRLPQHASRPSRRRRNTRYGALVARFRLGFHLFLQCNCQRSQPILLLGFHLPPQFNRQRNQRFLRLEFHLLFQFKCQRNQRLIRL